MKTQDAIKYLSKYRESIKKTWEISQNLSELKEEAVRLKDHEGQLVELDAAVAKYMDACKESERELDRLADLRNDIMGTLEEVDDDRLHSLLWRRYVSGFTWEQVAVSMSYSFRRIMQLRKVALRSVCDILDNKAANS